MTSREKSKMIIDVLDKTPEVNRLQLRIMLELHTGPERLVSQLAEVCCVSAPAISRTLDALESLGFTERTRDLVTDRRQVIVSLTNKGVKYLEKATA